MASQDSIVPSAPGARLQSINMSMKQKNYLVPEFQLDALEKPDTLGWKGQLSLAFSSAAVSAAVAFGIAGNWGLMGVSAAFAVYTGLQWWPQRAPTNERREIVRKIKQGAYQAASVSLASERESESEGMSE